jgi:hypothetical protein
MIGSTNEHDESIGDFSGWKIKSRLRGLLTYLTCRRTNQAESTEIAIPKNPKVVMPAIRYIPQRDMLP